MLKEYRSFLFHNLTNHKKITNNCVCFVTAFRSILPVQSEIEMILAFVVLSRLLLFGFVFLREFNSLFRVSRGQFVLLRGLSVGSTWYRWNRCVTSPGKLSSALAVVGFVAP